jgi:ATP-dependent Lon protease
MVCFNEFYYRQNIRFDLGGSVLFIESRLINPVEALDPSNTIIKDDKTSGTTGSLTLTGKLGDVMKESCKIALTYAKSFLQHIDPNNRSLRIGHIHVHVPEVNIKGK